MDDLGLVFLKIEKYISGAKARTIRRAAGING